MAEQKTTKTEEEKDPYLVYLTPEQVANRMMVYLPKDIPKIKKEKEGHYCPICREMLPKDETKYNRFTCCGNRIHKHCNTNLVSTQSGGNCPLCRARTPRTHEELVEQLRPWVEKETVWAISLMGVKYEKGEGVPQSYDMARKCYEIAGRQDDTGSLYHLGLMYYNGVGVQQSFGRAIKYYLQAANLDLPEAKFNIAAMYAKGEGFEQDYETAATFYHQAAKLGNMAARSTLATMYCYGQGVQQNYDTAKIFYEQACAQGDVDSMYALGIMYYLGKTVELSYERAKHYFEQAANLGNVKAQFNLGQMYYTGEGVDQQDWSKARELWTKAANSGDEAAITNLKILDIKEGRTIDVSSSSSAESTSNQNNNTVCSTCQKPQTETFILKKCSCRAAQYCNTKCQKSHRKKHMKECKRLTAERKLKKKKKTKNGDNTMAAEEVQEEEQGGGEGGGAEDKMGKEESDE